ncbi:MAG: polysaccharide biosynthesis protein [Clostridia bacterium]|nr:polysaccharide biosynthesis protein [Clostridia bacterium]
MRKTVFIKNAVILTVSSLILRFAGIIFKVWLAAAIGSEGIGLYQLVFSVYVLVSTFATSGISTAVTRLVADETALGSRAGVLKILRRCIELTLLIAFLSLVAVYGSADWLAARVLGDSRAAPALKILSFSLPFMGLCSCFRGYFIARRKATPTAFSQQLEQAVRIAVVLLLVRRFAARGLTFTCGVVLLGDTLAEASSALFLWLLYLSDKKKLSTLSGRARPPFGILRAILHISLPITAGRYLNSGLRAGENILMPKALDSYRGGGNSLSQFGMIKGMALPILFFPSSLLNALSTLLIPEMSEAAARGRNGLVRMAVERILRITVLLSFFCTAVFLFGGEEIGILVYKSKTVGLLLCQLAPIIPLMYLDSVSDGILKGLDQQRFTFFTAIGDSSLRIILILWLVPRFGLLGFLGIMYFSNFLTGSLNVGRLLWVSGARFDVARVLFFPFSAALGLMVFLREILHLCGLGAGLPFILLLCAVGLPLYLFLLFLLGAVSWDDLAEFRIK